MLKITDNKNQVSYVLTENERVSLVSEEAKELVRKKLEDLDRYVERDKRSLCFFTDVPVVYFNNDDNGDKMGWGFVINKDGKLHNCMYALDTEFKPIEKEAFYLMWRASIDNGSSYVEAIGDYFDEVNGLITPETTLYNDCQDYQCKEGFTVEEIVLSDDVKSDVRRYLGLEFLKEGLN